MKTEAETRKLIIIPNKQKYVFCPNSVGDCQHLDRSIIIFEEGVGRCSCLNLEAENSNMPKVDTIQICPQIKLELRKENE